MILIVKAEPTAVATLIVSATIAIMII